MTDDAIDQCTWTVGELADAAGVTVRTLHHYEQVGLLAPASRTSAGHRRYGDEQAERLYRITALRSLGLRLDEVRRALDDDDLRSVVRLHRTRVDEQVRRITELSRRLGRLQGALDSSGVPTDEIIRATEATVRVNLTTIYTRSGDDGRTSTAGGGRLPKDDPRVDAGGDVDELNAQLGVVRALLDAEPVAGWLAEIQNELFDLGAELSGAARSGPARVEAGYVERLELRCDQVNSGLPALDSFVLPGGGLASAQLQVARTVCRRAERRVVRLEVLNPEILRYLNRLSDLLFILARAVADDEQLWVPGATAQ